MPRSSSTRRPPEPTSKRGTNNSSRRNVVQTPSHCGGRIRTSCPCRKTHTEPLATPTHPPRLPLLHNPPCIPPVGLQQCINRPVAPQASFTHQPVSTSKYRATY